MKTYLLLIIMCNACAMFGQHYISVDKMIANFNEKKEVDNLKNRDVIYGFEEASEAGVFIERTLFPKDLPVENDIYAKWDLVYTSGYGQTLYLKKLYSSHKEKNEEAKMYESKLADKYGKDHNGIPALWYTGKITILSCPRNLFGEIVTKYVTEFSLEKGKVVSYKYVMDAKRGTMEGSRKPKKGVKYSPIQSTDGCWHDNFEYKLDLLEEFVNEASEKQRGFKKEFECSLLLVTNEKGEASGYLLSPEKPLNKKKQILVDKLMKRISELPAWSFGWLCTIDGSILQGRYLKATYTSDAGWRFKDYLEK